MDNREISCVLEEIADILEILDESPYKIKAYRNASNSIHHQAEEVEDLWRAGKLSDIAGVGKAIEEKLDELIRTGNLGYHQELLMRVPQGVVTMLTLPGIGPRTARTIYNHLGIDNFDDLLKAVKDREIRQLPGLGAKTEYNIKKGIEMVQTIGESVTLGTVFSLAQEFCAFLVEDPKIEKVELVGSIRRRKPVVHDIDILVATEHMEMVSQRVKRFRRVKAINYEDAEVIRGIMGIGFKFEVIVVKPADFPLALLLTTGCKEHRQQMMTLLQENGIASGSSEKEIYAALGMEWIPPELRENKDELTSAMNGTLPRLVRCRDIIGDLHIHTDWSDGAGTLPEMIKVAHNMGYAYIAITDHSKSLTISHGLNEKRVREQWEKIDQLNQDMPDFHILKGIEVDILRDGSLDLPDEILAQMDVVIASIHSHFNLSREEQTERIISAIRNPNVDIIGHLTGRLLNRRPGYELDVDKIIKEAALHKTVLEINAHPDRLDISEETAMQAKQMGVKVAINSDAHQSGDLSLMEFGIYNARRGGLEPSDVLNTLSLDDLLSYLNQEG
ncbi:MAG: DNA polymerase/3'-5' exonuclease PolX [Ignavibacteriales bacterium]